MGLALKQGGRTQRYISDGIRQWLPSFRQNPRRVFASSQSGTESNPQHQSRLQVLSGFPQIITKRRMESNTNVQIY